MSTKIDRDSVIRTIRPFLEKGLRLEGGVLDDRANLFQRDLYDSLQIVSLVSFLEETFECSLDFDELTESNLGSLAAIADLILRKKRPTPAVS